MDSFQTLLKESVSKHGHLCAGQVIGVRMAILGCRLIGINNPKDEKFRKKIVVFVEINRCAADAISSVTGCQLGKRTMKFKDFGINAATFINLNNHIAFRIVSTESSRDQAKRFAPPGATLKQQQLLGYQNMPDHLLFAVQQVEVPLANSDMPGSPKYHVTCDRCGQIVRDGKEILSGHETICRPCSDMSYFNVIQEYQFPETRNSVAEVSIS